MDVLADERRAPAVRASVTVRREKTDPFTKELALEVGLGDAEERSVHGEVFVGSMTPPALGRDRPTTGVRSEEDSTAALPGMTTRSHEIA